MEPCPICNESIEYRSVGNRDAYSVTCPICGEYNITRTALVNLRSTALTIRQRANIYGWLRDNPHYEISSHSLNSIENIPTPSFHDRADRLLLYFDRQTSYAGEKITKNKSWLGFCGCINEELNEIVSFLCFEKRISQEHIPPSEYVKIEPQGWSHIENLKTINRDSNQGFVAMWFSEEMEKIYNDAISIGIVSAGYRPHKVNQREHSGKIDDEIIAQIRRSRFILADFTGHRGGVYFEAGFAKGLNIEVIWSCREDDIENLHFDIRQYNCIIWNPKELEEYKTKISNRIEAVLGRGGYQVR